MANYRIRRDGTAHGFVKNQLRWNDGNNHSSETRMVCEGVRPAASNFVNYGGSVSWVIDAAAATTVEIWYSASYNNIYKWVNDGNGVPRPVAVRLY